MSGMNKEHGYIANIVPQSIVVDRVMGGNTDGTFNQYLGRVFLALQKADQVQSVSKAYATLTDDGARVRFLLKLDIMQNHLHVLEPKSSKDAVLATDKRQEGNKHFQQGLYKEALELYNDSIALAPCCLISQSNTEAKELAFGFANRSAAFFHLKRFENCLEDIHRALAYGYPEELAYKLYDRKIKCLQVLRRWQDVLDIHGEALTKLDLSSLNDKKKEHMSKSWSDPQYVPSSQQPEGDYPPALDVDKAVPKVHGSPNISFPSLSAACDVTSTPDQGRFIVAKQDIQPGDVILVEKPYASVVLLERIASHCHHCFKRLATFVPCSGCSLARFCGEDCRDQSLFYHKYECVMLNMIEQSGVGKFGHLAVRAVTLKTMKYLKEYQSKQKLFDASSVESQGMTSDGTYLADDYNAIFHLVGHSNDRSVQDLFRRGAMAVFLLKCLEKSGFFAEEYIGQCNSNIHSAFDEQVYVCSLILRHLQSLPCNAHEISELELNRSSVATSQPIEIGAGIYSTLSLFNHSCDPNVNRNFYGDTCVVRALKTIRKGEEVSDNYGAVYAVHPKLQRLEKLRSQYYFICACPACISDWPLYPDIEHQKPQLKCDKCLEILHVNRAMQCVGCGEEQNVAAKAQAIKAAEKQYEEGLEKLMACDVVGAMGIVYACLSTLERHVCLPWKAYNNCHEALKQCFSILGNCHTI